MGNLIWFFGDSCLPQFVCPRVRKWRQDWDQRAAALASAWVRLLVGNSGLTRSRPSSSPVTTLCIWVPSLPAALHLPELLPQYPADLPVFLMSQPKCQLSVGPTQSLSSVFFETGSILVSEVIRGTGVEVHKVSAGALGRLRRLSIQHCFWLRSWFHGHAIKSVWDSALSVELAWDSPFPSPSSPSHL